MAWPGSSWLSFPTRGVTDLGIFHPGILGLKYPSQVYLEAHMTSFISLKLTEDPVVKEAVDCQLQREGAWKKKSSTAMECQEIFESISNTNVIPTRENCDNYISSKRMEMARLKKAAKAVIASRYLEQTNNKSIQLEVQGHLATLLIQEESNMAWQSLIFSVPRGVMTFAARAVTNSLASPDNLARWKKIVQPKCPQCSISPCTLGHLLNNCKEALDRYEWRHNNIVKYLHTLFSARGMEAGEVFADLEGLRVNGVTVPADIAITGQWTFCQWTEA
jgi:hypothetical protein